MRGSCLAPRRAGRYRARSDKRPDPDRPRRACWRPGCRADDMRAGPSGARRDRYTGRRQLARCLYRALQPPRPARLPQLPTRTALHRLRGSLTPGSNPQAHRRTLGDLPTGRGNPAPARQSRHAATSAPPTSTQRLRSDGPSGLPELIPGPGLPRQSFGRPAQPAPRGHTAPALSTPEGLDMGHGSD